MTLNLSNTDSFQTICASTSSCSDMTVNLWFDDDEVPTDHGTVYCVELSSCDNLYIRSSSHLTQLFMYQQSDDVTLDNGAGYLSEFENIVCITDEWIRFDGFLETEDTVMDSIAIHYPMMKHFRAPM